MKAEDFADWCEGGRFGGKVMVQLKNPGTLTPMLDARRELTLAAINLRDNARKQLGRELTSDELAQVPDGDKPVPAVPVLIGTLEVRSPFLLMTYEGFGAKFQVTINPDDIQHISRPVATHIVT